MALRYPWYTWRVFPNFGEK